MLKAPAYAKINLHLHITGRAENGYHHLDSLVAFTDLADDIEIKPSDKFGLHISGDASSSLNCAEHENLVTRAAHMLAQSFNISPHVNITLTKNIPLAGGLGGGSADAATTLHLLQKLWNLQNADNTINSIAAELGSDIISCLHNKPVIMRETGNEIYPAPHLPKLYGLLVNPNITCPTPLVYKIYAQQKSPFSNNAIFPNAFDTPQTLCQFLKQHTANDLTHAAIEVAPVIQTVLTTLNTLSGCLLARLSGSGATCFGLFDNQDGMNKNFENIRRNHPHWWVKKITLNHFN